MFFFEQTFGSQTVKKEQNQGTTGASFSMFSDQDSLFQLQRAFKRDFQQPEMEDVFQCEIQNEQNLDFFNEVKNQKQFEINPIKPEKEYQETPQIFNDKKIKDLTIKNNNLPKFLIRVFLKECLQFAQQNGILEFDYKRVEVFQNKLKDRGANIWTTKDLRQIFGLNEDKSDGFNRNNRIIMNKILRATLKEEIIENKKVRRSKLSTLIASKVYAIRLRSSALASRVQSR